MKIKHALCALSVMAASSASLAAPITFDWSSLGSEGRVDEVSTTVNGVTATVTAWKRFNSGWEQGDVYVDANPSPTGLGIQWGRFDSEDVDGSNAGGGRYDEMLRISFSETVELDAIRFLDGDHNYNFYRYDDVDISINGSRVENELRIERNDVNGWISADYSGVDSVWLTADDSSDSWYLNGLRVNEVPEPATIALLGIGLISLGISRRKLAA